MTNYNQQPQQQVQYIASPPLNTLALLSFIFSLLGLGLVAVILGHMSLAQLKQRIESGHALAVAGLVIGYISIAIFIIVSIIFLITILISGAVVAGTGVAINNSYTGN